MPSFTLLNGYSQISIPQFPTHLWLFRSLHHSKNWSKNGGCSWCHFRSIKFTASDSSIGINYPLCQHCCQRFLPLLLSKMQNLSICVAWEPHPVSSLIITQYLSCSSPNIVYGIGSNFCFLRFTLYIGKSILSFRARMGLHRSDVCLEKDTPAANHFNKSDTNQCHSLHDFFCLVIEQVLQLGKLSKRENLWIKN